jgi:hypothetical protein
MTTADSINSHIKQIFWITLLFFSLTACEQVKSNGKKPSSNFAGKWQGKSKDENIDFQIVLKEFDNKIIGWHCGTLEGGSRTDCTIAGEKEPSINGFVENKKANLTIKTAYSDISLQAQLELLSNNSLQWTLLEHAEAEFYIPRKSIVLNKHK